DFRQVSVPLDPFTGGLDPSIDYDDLGNLAFQEDDIYGALAFTYIQDDQTQWRLSYGETVVRPDLREISESTYIDPL
ncbi:hypothetical protein, partial [Pseudoalteromonas sp. BSi20439]